MDWKLVRVQVMTIVQDCVPIKRGEMTLETNERNALSVPV